MGEELKDQLTLKYRPKTWKTFVGNDSVAEAIQKNLEKENIQRTIMLTGPYGTGKTTIARIIKRQLKVSDQDYRELDIGSVRGIDNVREIIKESYYKPLASVYKLYVLDECFHENSLVSTTQGQKHIKDIKIGDKVHNIYGVDTVEHVFKNTIPLSRVVKVLTNKGEIFCSKEHKFFTDKGWVEAVNLKGCNIFSEVDEKLRKKEILREGKYAKKEKKKTSKSNLPSMQERIFIRSTKWESLFRMFYDRMCDLRKKSKSAFIRITPQTNLFSKLRREKQACEYSFSGIKTKIERFFEKNVFNREREETKKEYFRTNEKQQPNAQKEIYQQNEKNQESKWYLQYLEIGKGWKRKTFTYSPTNFAFAFEMGSGISSLQCPEYQTQQKRVAETEQFTDLLQNRHCQSKIENRDRNRWGMPQQFEKKNNRRKERRTSEIIRVENIEIYKQRCNDKSFESIISDKERNKGFITFYDLQIQNHPSYKVNDCIVHNCHKATPDAKEAMLKWLEEPPKHAIIILATTNPSQFPNTIISRCAYYELKSLPKAKIKKILQRIISKENLNISDTLLTAIVENANGSPRQAVSILDSINGIQDQEEKALEIIERNQFSEASVLDICQGLYNNITWKIMAQYLSKLDDDADYEYIRYAVLKYMGKVLLNPKAQADSDRICEIITLFSEPFFYSKKAGLISSCYLASKI